MTAQPPIQRLTSEELDKMQKVNTDIHNPNFLNNVKDQASIAKISKSVFKYLQKKGFKKTENEKFVKIENGEEFVNEKLYDKNGKTITKDKKIEIINLLEKKTNSKETALKVLSLFVAFIALLILAGSITAICVVPLPIVAKALILGGGIVATLVIWGITLQCKQLRVKKNKFMNDEIQGLKKNVQNSA